MTLIQRAKPEDRKAEIRGIIELLQACLEEEGYVIPFNQYGDENWSAFNLPLRNKFYKEDNLFIKIQWEAL